MFVASGLILLGLALLVIGGEVLLRGSVGLATLLRLTPAVIGLTVVAAGTSVPELSVTVMAALEGSVDLAAGNIVGSNIFNIGVILGLCAVILPLSIAKNTVRLEFPVLALVTLLCLSVMEDRIISRLDGVLLLSIYVGFTAYMVALVREQVTAEEQSHLSTEVAEHSASTPLSGPMCAAFLLGGIVILGLGAKATVEGAIVLARAVGMSERVIGLTIVSAGTSLPEVVTSVVASLRGRQDVAVGNVIGSNVFNILVGLGASALILPLPVSDVIVNTDSWWMLGITLVLFPMLFTGARLTRGEGAALLGAYAVYLGVLILKPV